MTCGDKALATISAATAMIRVVFMWTSFRPANRNLVISVPAEVI